MPVSCGSFGGCSTEASSSMWKGTPSSVGLSLGPGRRHKWFDGAPSDTPRRPPDRGGVMIDGQRVELTDEEAGNLRGRVEGAMGAGDLVVEISGPDGPVRIPANQDTLAALAQLEAARSRKSPSERPPPPEVLLIRPNEETLELEMLVARRPTPPPSQRCRAPDATKATSIRRAGLAAEGVDRGFTGSVAGG